MLIISTNGVNKVSAEENNTTNNVPDTGNTSITCYIVPAVLLTVTLIAKKKNKK